jgi:hypothetical protein
MQIINSIGLQIRNSVGARLEFSIDNLKLFSKELMVDDEIINHCIYKIEYKGKEISNDDSSTRGFGLEVQLHG